MKLLCMTTDGLLYQRNAFGPIPKEFETAHWDKASSSYVTLAIIASHVMRITISTASLNPNFLKNNIVASQSDVFIYGRLSQISGNIRAGIAGHIGSIVPAAADGIDLSLPIGYSSSAVLREWNAGTAGANLDALASQNAAAGTAYSFWLRLNGKTLNGKDSYTNRNWAGTSLTRESGQVGVWSPNGTGAMELYSFYACAGRYVTVNGLNSGDVIRARTTAGTSLATANESAGFAVIDLMGVELTTLADLVVERSSVVIAQYKIGVDIRIVGGCQYSLDEDTSILPGLISRRHCAPLARRYSGTYDRTYFGGIDSLGNVIVSQVDPSTGATVSSVVDTLPIADSHSAPAILVDSDGYIWAFYSKHALETSIYYKKSTNPEDISAWGAKQTLAFDYNVTYPQVFQSAGGRIILMCRSAASNNTDWRAMWTDDAGANWSADRAWVSTAAWLYCEPKQHADFDTLSVLFSWHPLNGAAHGLYMARVDLDSGDITNPGTPTPIGNMYSGAAIAVSASLKLFTSDADNYAIGHDIDENGNAVFTQFDPNDIDGSARYKFVHFSEAGAVETIRDIAAAGVTEPSANWGECSLMGNGIVILIRESSGEYIVEKWLTANGGINWYSIQLDADPDNDVYARYVPIVPLFFDPAAPFIGYNRARSIVDESNYTQACDIVLLSALGASLPSTFFPFLSRYLNQ
jgi:hypothetical protein